MHQSTIHGVNTLGQIAATTALSECQYWLDDFVDHLHKMRQKCADELNTMKGVSCIAPEGCYVAFANIKNTHHSSKEIHELLLKEAKVAVVPGLKEWFGEGAEGYIRLSFATSDKIITQALSQIKSILNIL
jgi:bifunctional pyridoxal-dependent enzyme with beta-cystathionase and maltose regulon repressor activities